MKKVLVRVEYEATFEGYVEVPDNATPAMIQEAEEEEARGLCFGHEFECVVGFEVLDDEDG